MVWEVEFTDQFNEWWEGLDEPEQDSVAATVLLLGGAGPTLGHPHTSQIKGSKHGNMRELRIQHKGRPFRVLYIFDPRRTAILLIGGDKTGNDRWYEEFVPIADKLYDEHLKEIEREKSCETEKGKI